MVGGADLGRVPEPLTDSFEKRASGASAYSDQSTLALLTNASKTLTHNSRPFMQEKNLLKLQKSDEQRPSICPPTASNFNFIWSDLVCFPIFCVRCCCCLAESGKCSLSRLQRHIARRDFCLLEVRFVSSIISSTNSTSSFSRPLHLNAGDQRRPCDIFWGR